MCPLDVNYYSDSLLNVMISEFVFAIGIISSIQNIILKTITIRNEFEINIGYCSLDVVFDQFLKNSSHFPLSPAEYSTLPK